MNRGEVAVVWVDTPGSDWLGIYLDGQKIFEGHPPSLEEAFEALGVAFDEHTFPSDKLADLRRMRGLPGSLAEVER